MRRLVVRACTVAAFAGCLAIVGAGLLGSGRVLAQGEPDAATLAHGQDVYEYWCAPCHAPGPGHPGTQALQVKYGGDPAAVLLDRPDLTTETVALFVRQGISVMAPFRKTEIGDADLDALAAYIVATANE